jgi:hypothetical protein
MLVHCVFNICWNFLHFLKGFPTCNIDSPPASLPNCNLLNSLLSPFLDFIRLKAAAYWLFSSFIFNLNCTPSLGGVLGFELWASHLARQTLYPSTSTLLALLFIPLYKKITAQKKKLSKLVRNRISGGHGNWICLLFLYIINQLD